MRRGPNPKKLYIPMSRYISTGRLLDEVLKNIRSGSDDFLLNDKGANSGLVCCYIQSWRHRSVDRTVPVKYKYI